MIFLPPQQGPFNVGVSDIETDQVLLRLFYPTTTNSSSSLSSSTSTTTTTTSGKANTTTHWLPNSLVYSKGYATFMYHKLLTVFLFPILSLARKRATLDGPLLIQKGNNNSNNNDDNKKKFPVVVYCHGLGGMRTTYSTYVGNLASYGMIVASIEHRDKSAAVATKNKHSDEIPYHRPEKNLTDEELFKFRRDQIIFRVDEVFKAVDLLKQLNNGSKVDNIFDNKSLHVQLSGRMDWDNAAIVGHSFGGATAISVLQRPHHPFKVGVTQDPWMFATVPGKVNVPILSVQSETFNWKRNIKDIYTQFHKDLPSEPPSIFGVVKGTHHQSISDIPLLFPRLSRWLSKSGDVNEAMNVFVHSTMQFLARNMDQQEKWPHTKDYFDEDSSTSRESDFIVGESAFKFVFEYLGMDENIVKASL